MALVGEHGNDGDREGAEEHDEPEPLPIILGAPLLPARSDPHVLGLIVRIGLVVPSGKPGFEGLVARHDVVLDRTERSGTV